MVRKNQDEKKLKLNQPILSVRQSGKDDKRKFDGSLNSVPQPTLYRSESKLDPVRSPGVVPFVWEESPGKPKDGVKLQKNITERSLVVPTLNQQCFDKAIERLGVRNSEVEKEDLRRGLQCVQPSEKLIRKLGSFNSSKQSVEDYEISAEMGDSNEAYADSVGALSKSKLVFVDCKTGSFKGSDEPDRTSPHPRDFMIGLFLPATKTMASEIPLYVPGKQAVVQQLPRVPKNVAKAHRRPRLQLEPNLAWHCYQSHDCDDEGNKHETLFPAKACGVVPRLCVRSSIFILNPVPAMTVKARVHTSPSSRMHRYSFARSCTGANDERSTSGLRKQKSMVGQRELPQTYEMKAVLPTQGFAANAKKFSKKLQELLADHSNSTREDSGKRVPEKTLHMVESDSPVTKMKRQHKPMVDLSFRDASNLHVADERTKKEPFVQDTINFDLLTSAYELSVKSGRNPVKDYGEAHKRYELTITAVESDSEVDESSIKQEALTRKLKHSQDMNMEFPASPPLPKSPSDSWLFRTLPSVSTKTSPLRPYIGSENQRDQTSEVQPGDPVC